MNSFLALSKQQWTASSEDIFLWAVHCVKKTVLDLRNTEDGLAHKCVPMTRTEHSTKPCRAFCALQPFGGSSAPMRFQLEHVFFLSIV